MDQVLIKDSLYDKRTAPIPILVPHSSKRFIPDRQIEETQKSYSDAHSTWEGHIQRVMGLLLALKMWHPNVKLGLFEMEFRWEC